MNYLKMWRYIVGDSTGCILANWCGPGAYEIYLNINGASFSGASMQIGKSIDPGAGWHTLLDVSEVRDGLWHSFELRIRLNDPDQANGEIQFWLDGEERASFTGLDYGATAVDAFSKAALGIGNTGARDCSPQGTFQEPWRAIEYDDFVISDSYIGPVDAEPPDEDAPEEVEEISPEPADAWESAADAVEDPPPADAVSDAADASSDPVGEEEAATSNDGCGCRLVG
jgi:hypothetical protein